MEKVNWGILGTASIARRHAIPAMQAIPECCALAVASRDLAKAQTFASELGIPKAYGSYDQLLDDPEVEAVYIPLPNNMHLPWIQKATSAGKHVLCEKPLGLTPDEIRLAMQIAQNTNKLVVEGVTSYFHPIHNRAAELISKGTIGQLRFIRISLGWNLADKQNDFRWQPGQGGGALYDIGGYCISVARLLAGCEPQQVSAQAHYHPEHQVDTDMVITLTFPGSIFALIDFSLVTAFHNEYAAIGTAGKLVVENPFGNGAQQRTINICDLRGASTDQETFVDHQMRAQFAAVSQAIRQGNPSPLPLTESLANAMVMDACRQSALAGGKKEVLI